MPVLWNEVNSNASGGTELALRALEWHLPPEIMDEVQIVPARAGADTSKLDPTRIRILWCQDLAGDSMTDFLKKGGWRNFHKIVFVSYHQQQSFIDTYGVPPSRCVVLRNAITPLERAPAWESGPVRLVYTSTPHRGLDILMAVFSEICKEDDEVTLDVFSSFKIYGWPERDKPYERLLDACRSHPKVNYHGSAPNDVVRQVVSSSHVLAYPSTWTETSCIALIEAMSAGLLCVHSSLGALPETATSMTMMYPFDERPPNHAGVFLQVLKNAIAEVRSGRVNSDLQVHVSNAIYSWDNRIREWVALVNSLRGEPRDLPISGTEQFTYRIGG